MKGVGHGEGARAWVPEHGYYPRTPIWGAFCKPSLCIGFQYPQFSSLIKSQEWDKDVFYFYYVTINTKEVWARKRTGKN